LTWGKGYCEALEVKNLNYVNTLLVQNQKKNVVNNVDMFKGTMTKWPMDTKTMSWSLNVLFSSTQLIETIPLANGKNTILKRIGSR